LHISFTDGPAGTVTAELLRVMSPSAEVQGHSAAERKLVPGKKNVHIAKIDAVGNYAVKLTFDDGHSTGIYSWSYLHRLIVEGDELFAAYAAELEAAGLKR